VIFVLKKASICKHKLNHMGWIMYWPFVCISNRNISEALSIVCGGNLDRLTEMLGRTLYFYESVCCPRIMLTMLFTTTTASKAVEAWSLPWREQRISMGQIKFSAQFSLKLSQHTGSRSLNWSNFMFGRSASTFFDVRNPSEMHHTFAETLRRFVHVRYVVKLLLFTRSYSDWTRILMSAACCRR
jgi:hypothetical protein